VFLYCASEMKVQPEECLVIEDSATGIEGANAAGMLVWQFAGGRHYKHGYLKDGPKVLVDRTFDRMDSFFEAAPELKRRDRN
jgi:beta-phosphoglucomutase-like phosphatase (HAD superfamily)